MSIVTDPDDLDRFQVCVDPIAETISLKGLGTERHAVDSTGDSVIGNTTFTDAGANFTSDGVLVGDILTIISDPADDGGIIGHYRVTSGIGTTTLVVDRVIPASSGSDLTYKINAPQVPGLSTPQVADGVSFQALYSFLKEEWKTLAGSLGNAEDLIQFDFPMLSITTEEFILGGVSGAASSAWSFVDTWPILTDTEGVTTELIRTGGWQERSATNNILKRYLGVITLGSLDTDTQVYYQQHSETIDPVNIKLPGTVNQAVNIFDEVTGPDGGTGFAITGANTITRNDGGNWFTDGYRAGGRITIRAAEDAGNNGTHVIVSVANSTDGAIVVTSTLTNNASDTLMIAAVDKRFYLKLFARKKGRSYASATEFNAGIDVTAGGFLRGKVEKFPLAHATDPAIVLEDGEMAGDAVNDVFKEIETHATDTTGVTTDLGDGTFTFDAAAVSPAFNDGILQPGDSLEIASGSYQGFFEIKSITDADTIVCYHEPLLTYPGDETTLTFTTRTNTLDSGLANATLTDVDGDTATMDSAGATFTTDDGLGDRTVAADDIVIITAGDSSAIGVYKVVSVTDADTLVLDTSDQNIIGGPHTNQTYIIKRPGMHLQRYETNADAVGPDGGTGFDFNDANPDTIDRNDGGNWTTNNYDTVGMMITVSNAADPLNDGTYILASNTTSVLTLIAEEAVSADTLDTTAVFAGEYGIIRSINSVSYPFHWRLLANGGTLAQIFQFIQKELRRPTDVDEGNGTARGDITDLLMSFASPTGTTLDLFPDNLAASDLNNVTYQDMSGDARNNAFIVGITFQVNANLTGSADKRLVAFFTDPDLTPANGNEFGSNGAVIVNDKDGTPMDFTAIAGNITTTFDYTNNAQGSRTPGTDAAITVVAIGDDFAQHVLVTDTITQVNSKTIAVLPALERNYST